MKPSGLLAGATMAALVSCSGSAPPRTDVLNALRTEVIIPAFEQFESDATDLVAAIHDYCAGSGSVDDADIALASARASWMRTRAMWVGPVMDRRSWAVIDWPVTVADIEALMVDDEAIDEERIARRVGADQRGLGAIEHLLASQDPERAERRCDYLAAVAEVISSEASELVAEWGRGVGALGDMGVDAFVNEVTFTLDAIVDRELGVALGHTRPEPDRSVIVEGPGAHGVADLVNRLHSVRDVLLGPQQPGGLAPLLDDEVIDTLTRQSEAAITAVAAIRGPLVDALAADPTSVQQAMASVEELRDTVATTVVSHLGVTVGFSDADGDSSG